MPTTLNLPLFDVGYELEFFVTKPDAPHVILNASKEMEERLGFCIDQNKYDAGCLKLGDGYDLVTDGTACEVRWFKQYNNGTLPDRWIPQAAHKVLKDLNTRFTACVEEGDDSLVWGRKTVFDSPGRVFSSLKLISNAYTHKTDYAEKKEDAQVTRRTAGLHLHFSVSHSRHDLNELIFRSAHKEDHLHTDALVRLLDEIYDVEIVRRDHFTAASKRRVEKYQKLGDYRIRGGDLTETGCPTLEYRQLDASMADRAKVQRVIDIFQYEARKYLEGVINA